MPTYTLYINQYKTIMNANFEVQWGLGSITSRYSGKEPTFFPDQTRESGGNRA